MRDSTLQNPPPRNHSPDPARSIRWLGLAGILLMGNPWVAACGRLDSDDVIRPDLLEAALVADPAEPFERADVSIALRLEAGANIQGQQIVLEWVRLFEGSGWRTTEPAVDLRLRLPEGAGEPFEAGEIREVALEGYIPNDDLAGFCGRSLRLMVATRTTGIPSMVGLADDVTVLCSDAD